MYTHFRVGFGYDIHKLDKERPLVLGGVEIPHDLGLVGDSDADVLVHAVIDSLLGAASLRDIGHHFPPGDSQYQGVRSIELLVAIARKLESFGVEVINIDTVVILEEPFLAPFINQMKHSITDAIGISLEQLNIKATTNQGLGVVGSKEAIAAFAVALVQRGDV